MATTSLTKPTTRQLAANPALCILKEARAGLEKYGWRKGTTGSESVGMCAVGGTSTARARLGLRGVDEGDANDALAAALHTELAARGRIAERAYTSNRFALLVNMNDGPATFADIVAAHDEAIASLEAAR